MDTSESGILTSWTASCGYLKVSGLDIAGVLNPFVRLDFPTLLIVAIRFPCAITPE